MRCGEWIIVGAKLETSRPVGRYRQETMIAWAKTMMMEKDKWTNLGYIFTQTLSISLISLAFIDHPTTAESAFFSSLQ